MKSKQTKQEIVNQILDSGFLVNPNFLNQKLEDLNLKEILEIAKKEGVLFIDSDILVILKKNIKGMNWVDFEASKAMFEKGNKKPYEKFVNMSSIPAAKKQLEKRKVKITSIYQEKSKKREVLDFVAYYNQRFRAIEGILSQRQELQNPISIARLKSKKDKETVSLIGMVKSKNYTKNQNLIISIEDESGEINVLINKNKPELYNLGKDIVLDEVIGVVGVNAENIVFANNILWPDIPLSKEFKKSPEEEYAVFTADLHVGSKMFLENEFNQFLEWINCRAGNETQKKIASKVKYIFIVGDLIDGVGIYPNQEKELKIKDFYEQYSVCAEFLKKIPEHIELIICPGNHDAMRIAEPQPVLYEDFAKPIWNLPNVTMISNPGIVNIGGSETFPGFDVFLYHGYSFDFYVPNVESIRNSGGYDRADMIMKFLLQRRHLAPTHTSTLFLPETNEDPLVIKTIPDFFVSGHIHNKPIVANYRNITTISCGCWQSKTPFQEKVGHNPGPSKIPVVNLKTRDVKILRFDR